MGYATKTKALMPTVKPTTKLVLQDVKKPVAYTKVRTASLSVGAIVGIVISTVCGPLLCIACLIGILCCCGCCSVNMFKKKDIQAETTCNEKTTYVSDTTPGRIYY
jgi:hypothetical protein